MKLIDVYDNVEYFEIISRGKTLFRLEGENINGKTKSEVEYAVGEALGEGYKNFVLKFYGEAKSKTGRMRGRIKDKRKELLHVDANINDRLNALENIIKAASKESTPNAQTLMDMQRQTMQIQIDFYKNLCDQLERKVQKLEKEIESGGAGSAGIDTILNLAQIFLSKKGAGKVDLGDEVPSDPGSIPPEFIQALGKVDYTKVSPDQQEKILKYFNMLSSQLPMKGN